LKLNTTFAAAMAAIAVCPIGAAAEVYSCEIKEWVRVNDEGLVRLAPSAPFKRHVSIDKETGNAVGDALSVANRWEIAQKGSQENAFVTLGQSPMNHPPVTDIPAYNAFKDSKASMRRAIGTADTRPQRTARPPA
jgi:hypothetical protein